jgi:hypothetical protein
MTATQPRLVIVVKPAPGRTRLPEVLRWVRALVPSALLLVAPVNLPDLGEDQVIQLDCADGLDGPLAVATQLGRHLPG